MEKSGAPALTSGLEIIELIAEEGEIGFNSISEIKGISVSSLNRILKVLVSKGYLVKNITGKYMLGTKIFALAKIDSNWNGIMKKAAIALKEISEKYEATALLFGFSEETIIALDKVINIDSVVMQQVGTVSRHFLSRPWGYVYMSSLDDIMKEKFIKIAKTSEYDKPEIPNDSEIEKYIQFAKNHGYSDDYGKIKSLIRRISVPIYNSKKEVVLALAVGFVNGAISEDKIEELIIFLKSKAEELNKLIQI